VLLQSAPFKQVRLPLLCASCLYMPGASGPETAYAYLVGCVDGGEGALKAAHLLRANVGLAAKVSAKQVIVAVLDCCQLVVF
jgi:hypothetical protein